MAIEKNIWQTYETTLEDLPEYGKFGVDTWKKNNPTPIEPPLDRNAPY